MRDAVAQFFARSDLMALPVLSLVIFVLVFGAMLVRVWRAGPRPYEAVRRLPLEHVPEHVEAHVEAHVEEKETVDE